MKRKLIALFVLLGSVGMAQAFELTEKTIKEINAGGLENTGLIDVITANLICFPNAWNSTNTAGDFNAEFIQSNIQTCIALDVSAVQEFVTNYLLSQFAVETDETSTYPDIITAADVAAPQPKKTKLVLKS